MRMCVCVSSPTVGIRNIVLARSLLATSSRRGRQRDSSTKALGCSTLGQFSRVDQLHQPGELAKSEGVADGCRPQLDGSSPMIARHR